VVQHVVAGLAPELGAVYSCTCLLASSPLAFSLR
jgi:hypothetical protein